MRILFFAQSRDAAGCAETSLALEQPIASAELWNWLEAKYSGLAPFRAGSRLARNDAYLAAEEMIQPHDEIAVIPPVSGG